MHICIYFIQVCFPAPSSAHPSFIAQSIQRLAQQPTPAEINSESGSHNLNAPSFSPSLEFQLHFTQSLNKSLCELSNRCLDCFTCAQRQCIRVRCRHHGHLHRVVYLLMNMSGQTTGPLRGPKPKLTRVLASAFEANSANLFAGAPVQPGYVVQFDGDVADHTGKSFIHSVKPSYTHRS
jgi:hypothetical protein